MDERINNLFEVLFALTDLRVLFRETAPLHAFSEEQKDYARDILNRAKEALNKLEEAL
jgi:benzoyl-CoA reductase/2-hydroxyglutaryl-CoA dehydratase subunit BcrC/BadD/HgdB